MDDWQQDWMKTLDTLTKGVEQFFQDVSKEISEAADAWLDFTEEIAEELDRTLSPGFDQLDHQINEWVEPLLEAILGFESAVDRAVEPVTHTVEPILNQHPVCVGCRNYHGQMYNGVMLVCGMHPYGVPEGADYCADKEATTWTLPSNVQESLQDWMNHHEDDLF